VALLTCSLYPNQRHNNGKAQQGTALGPQEGKKVKIKLTTTKKSTHKLHNKTNNDKYNIFKI
jgi:hypothetical protein